MNKLKYVTLDKVNIDDFKNLLNKQKIREHLMEHELFNSNSVCEVLGYRKIKGGLHDRLQGKRYLFQ